MKGLIIYHRVDWDGYTSAAIALKKYPTFDLLGWTYGKDPLPNTNNYDVVVLLDLTISMGGDYTWMYENADKLIWIDHHDNAMNTIKGVNIEGVRESGIGACVLAWKYFFPGKQIPLHVALCGTYDIFRKDGRYASWDDAWHYQLALDVYSESVPKTMDSSIELVDYALKFINEPIRETIKRLEVGEGMEIKRAQKEDELFKSAVFSNNNGMVICKLIADGRPASLIRNNSEAHTADLYMLRSTKPIYGTDDVYKVSLRVPDGSDVDASKIARMFGGNGHIKAAGCNMKKSTFDKF